MATPNPPACPSPESYPSFDDLQLGLGAAKSAAAFAFSVGVFVVNTVLFIILIIRFIKTVPSAQVPSQVWVTSLPTGLAFCQLLMIFLPNSSEFLLLAFSVYEAVIIYKFVDLNLKWFGGEKKLLESVGVNPVMRFNLPPLCCVLLCLRETRLTRKKIRFVRLVVSQMVYIQIFVLFIQQVLIYQKSVDTGLLSASNPNTFLNLLGRISFFAGFWGLFVFFNIDFTFKLLKYGKFKTKFLLMKATLVLFVTQEILIEVLVSTHVISCSKYLSYHAMGAIVMCIAIMVESSILGLVQFVVYYRNPTVETAVLDVIVLPETSEDQEQELYEEDKRSK